MELEGERWIVCGAPKERGPLGWVRLASVGKRKETHSLYSFIKEPLELQLQTKARPTSTISSRIDSLRQHIVQNKQ